MNPPRFVPARALKASLLPALFTSGLCGQIPIGGTVTGTLTAGVYHATSSLQVPVGQTLTLNPGVIVKFANSGQDFLVAGTLRVNGTAGNPVVFTGIQDDSAGGDTNGNGPSSASPTAWRGVMFGATASASVLTHADIRYGGAGFVSNVHLNSSNPTFANCTIRHNYTHGMQLSGNSFPTVTNCTFTANGGNAIEAVPVMALAGFLGNTASGNNANIARVSVGTVSANLTVTPASMLGGALTLDVTLSVPAGVTLAFAPGVVCKLMNQGCEVAVAGTLQVNGTAGSPVVFTGFADDSAGGDTNNNGASSASPTAWRGVVFASTASSSVLDYADIRYGGAGFVSNVHLDAASPTLRHCTIRNNYTHGMLLSGNSLPTVADCTFSANGGLAVEGVQIVAVPGFTNNTAVGNADNYLHVTSADITSVLKIGPQSIMQGALVMATNLRVLPSGWLTVEQGVVFKFSTPGEVVVDGSLFLRGTSYEPIVFTAFADDSVAGDTNNNGPSNGSATAWRGITWNNSAAAGFAENVVIRYTGSGFVPALSALNPHLDLRAVRVDHAYDRGFVLQALGTDPTNLIAFGCGGFGIQLTGGAFQVLHATCVGNGSGLRRETGWSGNVVNSISYGNGSNFANFGSGTQVLRSNGGFAGSNGNLNVDPSFVNQAGGDLHLQTNSPCLGVAELFPALLARKDFDENSRILDHALTGNPAADMGAFELPAWSMQVAGVARPGSTLTFTLSGPPGDSFIALGLLDGATPFFPWGMLLAGANPGTSVALLYPVPLPVGFPIPLPLVNDPALLAISAGIQTLTLPSGNVSLGNFTRLYRILVRP